VIVVNKSSCRKTLQQLCDSDMDISLEQLEEAVVLRRKMDILEKRLGQLIGAALPSSRTPETRGHLSAVTRAKIAAAQRARWAKVRRTQIVSPPAKKKGGLTPAGRRKLSQLMKARWAARRRAAGSR
jgi:hypothetical protein